MAANRFAQLRRSVGQRLAELRADRAWTQELLAERLGVSVRYLQSMEAGNENLTLESLTKISIALRAKVRDLFEPPTPQPVNPPQAKRSPPRQGPSRGGRAAKVKAAR